MIDEAKQLKIVAMNDRAQGGTVIAKSRIEFMINRRLMHDDKRGLKEALNETDAMGRGISVPATFYI